MDVRITMAIITEAAIIWRFFFSIIIFAVLSQPCLTFRFKCIVRKHGLPDGLNVHSLRHSNVSLLISQNVDVRTVASLLGPAQASTTLDIYSHAFDKYKKGSRRKVGWSFGYISQVGASSYPS